MFCLSYKNHDFLVNFSEFAKMCSNEYIFVFPLANLDFRGYVRSGRWVGEVSQTGWGKYPKQCSCARERTREEERQQKDWSCESISFGEVLPAFYCIG